MNVKSSYRLQINKLVAQSSAIARCVLEAPELEQQGSSNEFRRSGIQFRGWVLLDDQLTQFADHVQVVLKGVHSGTEYANHRVDMPRDDVIRHFYPDHAVSEHAQRRCGFEFEACFDEDHVAIYFAVDGELHHAFDIHVQSSLAVLVGAEQGSGKNKSHWLFLDNDTNNSVAQHTGELRLNRKQRKAWQQYMSHVQSIAARHNIDYALLVAPAKEAVFYDKHPLPRAKHTVMEDMLSCVPDGFHLVYPVDELRDLKARSFRVTDTHWSAQGAAEASVLAVQTFGRDIQSVRDTFAADTYKRKRLNGDLGIKLFPPGGYPEDVLTNYRYRKHLVYDNGLPNFGRVMVVHNPDALYQQRCLIFGSSSAYSMLAYLSRVFSQLVLIHCAGNVDESVLADVAPDCMLLQTNARFVVRAPQCDYSLEQEMGEKLARLSSADIKKLRKSAEQYANATELGWVATLHQRLQRALG